MATSVFSQRSNLFSVLASKPKVATGAIAEGGAKRIKLSSDAIKPKPFDADAALSALLTAIPLILGGTSTLPFPVQTLQAHTRTLVSSPARDGASQSHSERIYEATSRALEDAARGVARSLRAGVMGGRGGAGGGRPVEWLREVEGAWSAWEANAARLSAVLIYLDRRYIPQKAGLASIRDLTISAFRAGVLEDPIIAEKSLSSFSAWLTAHKAAGYPDAAASSELRGVHAFASVLLVLGAQEPFVARHIEQTRGDAASASAQRIETIPRGRENLFHKEATGYVSWVTDLLVHERETAQAVWSGEAGSEGPLKIGAVDGVVDEVWAGMRREIESECIEKHLVEHAQRAMDEALLAKDANALKRMYKLCIRVRKFTVFKNAFAEHIRTESVALVSDESKDATMVATLLAFKHFLDSSVAALCDFDPQTETESLSQEATVKEEKRRLVLENEIREGLKHGVETRQAKPAELIAKHLDSVMRKGQGALTSKQFEHNLDEIVNLVKFTKDKDVFKEFYMTQLAKRLLLNKSASNEEELAMVKKLKMEYGDEFTTGDAMMKDLSSSDDMNNKYQEVLVKNGKGESNLTVYVLSQGQWPQYKQLQKGWEHMQLPKDMQKQLDDFAAWYNHVYSGRVLSWRHQHTTVTLTARFPGGNKEIGVSLFQAMVLLQFNGVDTLDYEQLYERTGIERGELIRTLQSLYAQKATRMLIKRPPGKEVEPTDKFIYNSGFTRDRIKFKINQLQQDLSAEETKQATERVFEDRVLTLDAQIVRIMKGKKALKLPELVNQTVEAVSKMFMPEVKAIKTQIESLIEREYLERDENDRNLLKYLA